MSSDAIASLMAAVPLTAEQAVADLLEAIEEQNVLEEWLFGYITSLLTAEVVDLAPLVAAYTAAGMVHRVLDLIARESHEATRLKYANTLLEFLEQDADVEVEQAPSIAKEATTEVPPVVEAVPVRVEPRPASAVSKHVLKYSRYCTRFKKLAKLFPRWDEERVHRVSRMDVSVKVVAATVAIYERAFTHCRELSDFGVAPVELFAVYKYGMMFERDLLPPECANASSVAYGYVISIASSLFHDDRVGTRYRLRYKPTYVRHWPSADVVPLDALRNWVEDIWKSADKKRARSAGALESQASRSADGPPQEQEQPPPPPAAEQPEQQPEPVQEPAAAPPEQSTPAAASTIASPVRSATRNDDGTFSMPASWASGMDAGDAAAARADAAAARADTAAARRDTSAATDNALAGPLLPVTDAEAREHARARGVEIKRRKRASVRELAAGNGHPWTSAAPPTKQPRLE